MPPHASHAIWTNEFAASHRALLRFLRRRTRCDETARDLAQDAWLRVAEHHATGNSAPPSTPAHARAYLFVVAERLAIDHLRRERHWHAELAPRLQAGTHHSPDVAESHAYAQALRAVERALSSMPTRMREVFVAHRLEGVLHDELARRHQVSRKTIEREVTKAMDLAQDALLHGLPVGGQIGTTAAASATASATIRQGRRKALGALLGLAGVSSSTTLAWQLWHEWMPQWQTAFATKAGQLGRLALPDGSELTLGAESAVDVHLLAARREVTLRRGAAYFAVARDASRPFVVRAGRAHITVLGTRFSVEMDEPGDQAVVKVAVESGRVSVRGANADALELGPGDTVRVRGLASPQRTRPHPADAVAPWRTGWLDFDQVPLAEAAAQLNRYRPAARVTVAPAVAGLPVLARVNIARSTQWLQGLPAVLPVSVAVRADASVVIGAR